MQAPQKNDTSLSDNLRKRFFISPKHFKQIQVLQISQNIEFGCSKMYFPQLEQLVSITLSVII